MATGTGLQYQRPLTSVPSVIQTTDDAINGFLAGLIPVDFRVVADPKGIWAVVAGASGEGTSTGTGTAWVVSWEAVRRIKSHRYSQSGQ